MITLGAVKQKAKGALHHAFEWGQRLGVDILPRHYYSSIPDLQSLKASKLWREPCSMIGVVGTEIDGQLRFVESCCTDSLLAYLQRTDVYALACRANGAVGYGKIEAEFLAAFVCARRPRRIVQIGAGVSTAVIVHAMQEFHMSTNLVCIGPYPTHNLARLASEKQIDLIRREAQRVELEILLNLSAGDLLLFVDSTHTMRPDSEVNRIIFEVLPRHFHDIYFPYDYQTVLLSELFFSGESSLLHAFLIHNSRYRIAVSLSMLHHAAPKGLQKFFPHYKPARMNHGLYRSGKLVGHFPSSTYLEVVN